MRNVLGAIAGYVAMVIVALAGIGVGWMTLGAAGAFAGEGPAPSTAWMAFNLVTGFVGASIPAHRLRGPRGRVAGGRRPLPEGVPLQHAAAVVAAQT